MNGKGPVLRDIHLSAAGWWPPALGWWIVAALALLLIAVIVGRLWWRARARALTAALREIEELAAAHVEGGDAAALAAGASRLLRRVALRIEPDAAALHGDAWRDFLQRHARDAQAVMLLDRLSEAAFRPCPEIDPVATLKALRAWCAHALRTAGPGPRGVGRKVNSACPTDGRHRLHIRAVKQTRSDP